MKVLQGLMKFWKGLNGILRIIIVLVVAATVYVLPIVIKDITTDPLSADYLLSLKVFKRLGQDTTVLIKELGEPIKKFGFCWDYSNGDSYLIYRGKILEVSYSIENLSEVNAIHIKSIIIEKLKTYGFEYSHTTDNVVTTNLDRYNPYQGISLDNMPSTSPTFEKSKKTAETYFYISEKRNLQFNIQHSWQSPEKKIILSMSCLKVKG
jgi:hypothetical protein